MVVEMYSTKTCPQCVIAENILKSKGVDYVKYIVGEDRDKSEIEERCDCTVRSVPQFFVDDQYIPTVNALNEFLAKEA